MQSARSLLSTSEGSVESRGFGMVGNLVWEKGRKQPHPLDGLMKGNVWRVEEIALSSSQGDTLVPKSHHAECCGQIRFPKELSLLAVLWHWDSLHALAMGPALEVSGIPSALETFNTGRIFPCHSQSQVPAVFPGLDVLWRWVLPVCTITLLPQDGRGVCPPCCSPSQPPTPSSVQGGSPARLWMLCPGSNASPPAFPAHVPQEPLPPVH